MAMDPSVQWELEGELLKVQMILDKLRTKKNLDDHERGELMEAERRKGVIEERIREGRMRG